MTNTPSKPPLAEALQTAGKALADADIAGAFLQAEESRQRFATDALVAGLMLLAKRSTFPARSGKGAGKWQTYLEKLLASNSCSTLQLLPETLRTAQVYMNLARRLLWQLENRTWEKPQVRAHYTPEQCEALASAEPSALAGRPLSCREQIERIVAGRSIRRLLEDFREAQRMADAETEDEGEKTEDPPRDTAQYVQQRLWEDWTNELEDIDRLLLSEHAHYLDPKEHWSRIADKLEEQAARARQLADAAQGDRRS